MEDFRFFLDADIEKSSNDDGKRIIRGYASTEAEDRQNESLVQKGLDISDFINYGFFNYDHNNKIIVGYPFESCAVDSKGLWVEGELLKGIEEADRMWDLALALKKSKAPRQVGFSIEGKILKREGNKITKAKIYNIAVTTNPVNTNCTWEAVVKSFSDNDILTDKPGNVDKALEAGYEINPEQMEGGSTFRRESLESDLHNLSYVIDNDQNKNILKQKLQAKKSLTFGESILYFQIVKGWSFDKANKFVTKYSK